MVSPIIISTLTSPETSNIWICALSLHRKDIKTVIWKVTKAVRQMLWSQTYNVFKVLMPQIKWSTTHLLYIQCFDTPLITYWETLTFRYVTDAFHSWNSCVQSSFRPHWMLVVTALLSGQRRHVISYIYLSTQVHFDQARHTQRGGFYYSSRLDPESGVSWMLLIWEMSDVAILHRHNKINRRVSELSEMELERPFFIEGVIM